MRGSAFEFDLGGYFGVASGWPGQPRGPSAASVLCLLVSEGRMSGVSELAAEQDTCRRISATAVQVKVLQ